MSTGSGGKPPSGSSPGSPAAVARAAADTPQRLVVRSLDPDTTGAGDSVVGMNDTAVAANEKEAGNRTSMAMTAAVGGSGGASDRDIVGTTLSGRYLVTRKVGQGGMGAVYEATHTLIGKRVAVKVLLEKYARREALVQRLEQEAKLASSVGNEHIIDITDFGQTEDGRTFVVMEYLEGESLAECLARESRLPEQRILRIAAQVAAALAAAHDKGVVHRDIKPENLFLLRRKEQDFVKVLDFGISKSLRASSEEEEQPRLTQTGMVLGTPLYMSPEQSRGDEDLDHRVDIYALGVIMYEAAVGRVPFAGTNYLSVISQVLNEEPPPPRELRPELTEEFEAIVQRAMAKDRNERYAQARDLSADLSSLVDDPTRSTERAKITGPRKKPLPVQPKSGLKILGWAAGVAVLIAAVVVIVTFAMGGSSKPEAPLVVKPVVVPAVADAAVAPAPDAEEAAIQYVISTEPKGAMLYRESEQIGVAPQTISIADRDKDVIIRAEADGYVDGALTLNPHEDKTQLAHTITLKKAPKGAPPPQHPPHTLPHAGSGSATPAVGSGSGVRGDGTISSPFGH